MEVTSLCQQKATKEQYNCIEKHIEVDWTQQQIFDDQKEQSGCEQENATLSL
eukprot:m.76470 g.76470  ORF g.76470 m.76470 type:complete len:52 (-) comp12560_c0_seq3:16-171(-)